MKILKIQRFRLFNGSLPQVGLLAFLLLLSPIRLLAQPFALSDSSPESPDFRERFLASYGVNSAIEPTISADDRPLYERIAPYLREDPQRAIREVEAELSEDANPAFHYLLGNLYYQTEQPREAERYLKQAVEKFPDFRRAQRTLGLIYIRDGRYDDAIQAWLKVITLGGGDAQSYGLLGYAYLSKRKYQSALNAYQMARMFKPDSVDFRRGEARSLLETNQWDPAVALFDELIAEDPSDGDYLLLQANAFLKLEREADAIANLELAHSFGQGTAQSRFLLGDLYLQADNHALALEQYAEAITRSENWTFEQAVKPLRHLLARRLIDDADQYLEVLEPRLPASLEEQQAETLAVAEAKINYENGRSGKAVEVLENVVENNPIHGEALLLLAGIQLENGDREEAEFYFQRARSVPEYEVDALIALGRLEVARGDLDKALDFLRTAREHESRAGIDRYIESIEAAK